MIRMLRMKLEIFDLATEREKPETYNREFNRVEALSVTVDTFNKDILEQILRDFLSQKPIHPFFEGASRDAANPEVFPK